MKEVPRIIHFVTGGGSGATKVALDLACGHLRTGSYSPLLVLRRKKTPLPAAMQEQIAATGLRTAWVEKSPKSRTLRQLSLLIAEFRPQVFVAHGNSEHLWGRRAAFAAKVPVVVHVEHNCERYFFWRRNAARKLAAQTSATVCVSYSVSSHVRELRLQGPRLEIISNGVDTDRFSFRAPGFDERGQDIVMTARFARQKDHPTLIRAVKLLADRGWTGRLLLCGGGKPSKLRACMKLADRLGLHDRVEFMGNVANVVPLLHRCRAAVLSTHYEGLPLSLVEYMGAGCAVVASEVPGVTDILMPGVNGWLFPEGESAALADALTEVLAGGPAVKMVVNHGREDAFVRYSLALMIHTYEDLFAELLSTAKRITR